MKRSKRAPICLIALIISVPSLQAVHTDQTLVTTEPAQTTTSASLCTQTTESLPLATVSSENQKISAIERAQEEIRHKSLEEHTRLLMTSIAQSNPIMAQAIFPLYIHKKALFECRISDQVFTAPTLLGYMNNYPDISEYFWSVLNDEDIVALIHHNFRKGYTDDLKKLLNYLTGTYPKYKTQSDLWSTLLKTPTSVSHPSECLKMISKHIEHNCTSETKRDIFRIICETPSYCRPKYGLLPDLLASYQYSWFDPKDSSVSWFYNTFKTECDQWVAENKKEETCIIL